MEQPPPVILFDGVCNFCDGAVNFILRRDRHGRFRFAPLQSTAGQQLLKEHALPQGDLDSFVLIDKGHVYKKSGAALRVLGHLPWYWKPLQALWLVPRALRDAVYDYVARHRYKWFGQKEQCMIPTPDVRSRFLQ